MQYMGGKERQARHIVEQILKYKGTCTRYMEPFVGGASVLSRVAPHFPGNAHGSDTHPDLIMMWQAVTDGWKPPAQLSREEYGELRNADPSALRAFAGFGCSFGGKWFGGYASNARGDDFCGAARRGVLKKARGLAGVTFTLGSYEDLTPGTGTLVYCDPPYAATTGYSVGDFDSDRFWRLVQGWADNGATVLVSEYKAPEYAEEVWRRGAVKSLKKDSNSDPAVEKLFLVRPTSVPAEAQPGRPPTAAEVESWKAYENDMRDDLSSDLSPTVDVVDDSKPYATAPCGIQECCGDDDVRDDSSKGPWFSAEYSGECSAGYCVIEEGDWIRADGQGGYECENCGEDGIEMMPADWQQQVPERGPLAGPAYVDELRIPAPPGPMPTPDEFMDPGVGSSVIVATGAFDPHAFMDPANTDDPADKLNVSGQPNARYEWYGSQNRGYLVKEPHTGDFRRYKNGKPKGLTRATTFNKAASDSKAINDWGKRNIVIGASRRRDILLRAHGLTHENNRRELESIVAELEKAAGAKVGSDLGTYLHEFTEQMDAGLKTPDQAPEEFQGSLWRYEQALLDAGLEPVPGLIERTTMITEYGGVVGTFDRIFYHRPSGTYIVGDLKTGKTMEYAMNETETQMWIYAHGVNQNGVYDWNTDTWERAWPDMSDQDPDEYQPIRVREDVGVIIHMPVQGPLAGQVVLDHADLQAGARHAELCHRNRTAPKSKVRPFEPPLPARPLTWEERFALVTSSEHATQLWREAKAAGIAGVRLNELVSVARQVLAGKG